MFCRLVQKDCFRALSTLLRTINGSDRGKKTMTGRSMRSCRFNEGGDCLFVVSRCSSELYAFFCIRQVQPRETPSFYACFNYLQSSFLRDWEKTRKRVASLWSGTLADKLCLNFRPLSRSISRFFDDKNNADFFCLFFYARNDVGHVPNR